MPDRAPGLQLSYFGVYGKGNTVEAPDWTVSDVMASFEHDRFTLTGQYYVGEGNQKGDAVDESGRALSREGFSFFAELELPTPERVSVIGRYDYFDFDTEADGDEKERVIAGVAWDLGRHNTLLLDYDRVSTKGEGADESRVQLTLQVKY